LYTLKKAIGHIEYGHASCTVQINKSKLNEDKMPMQYLIKHADQITNRYEVYEIRKQGGLSVDTSCLSFILSEASYIQ
jgi:hypothetical protein